MSSDAALKLLEGNNELLRTMGDTLARIEILLAAPKAKHVPRSAPDKRQSAAVMQGRAESAPKTMDLCFVALAEIEGSEPARLTASGISTLEYALRQIRTVMPTVTPEEIRQRAARHKKKFSWDLTGPSLAKHWAKLAGMPPPSNVRVPPEPQDWARRFAERYGDNGWSQMEGQPQRVQRDKVGGYQILRWADLGSPAIGNLWKEFV